MIGKHLKDYKKAYKRNRHENRRWCVKKNSDWKKRWMPFIKYDHDFDGFFLIELINHKLHIMLDFYEHGKYCMQVDESRLEIVDELREACRLGDLIIADEFNVTQDTIISVNNIKQSRLIQPGQYLKIPSMPGIIYTVKKNGETAESIAKKYEINAEKCAFVNNINVSSELNAGAVVFVPDAELDWTTRQEINGDLFKKPLHSRYWLSSPYGWRDSPFSTGKRTFHGGLDMAASQGTPIYPALDGKVTAVGFNSTYGNYVIISHHSGYKTLYAHMSTVNCKKGNFVYTNTMIGRVGSTGMSTGPHLHFTVYKNGKTVNPSLLLN